MSKFILKIKKVNIFFKMHIEKFLNKKCEIFIENYKVVNNKEPRNSEIEKYRKDVVMKYSLIIYIPFTFFLFLLIQVIKGGI